MPGHHEKQSKKVPVYSNASYFDWRAKQDKNTKYKSKFDLESGQVLPLFQDNHSQVIRTASYVTPSWLSLLIMLNLICAAAAKPSVAMPDDSISPELVFSQLVAQSQSFFAPTSTQHNCVYPKEKLETLVENVPIKFYISDADTLPVPLKKYKANCEKLAMSIRKNLYYAMNHEMLTKLLEQPDFKIVIVPPHIMSRASGSYEPHTNAIFITWREQISAGELQQILANEGSHASQCFTHKNKQSKTSSPCYFVSQPELIEENITAGLTAVRKMKRMFQAYNTKNNVNNKTKSRSDFLEAIKDYQPLSHSMHISKADHSRMLALPGIELLANGILFFPEYVFPTRGVGHTAKCYVSIQEQPDSYEYKISFAKDNQVNNLATAFFFDMEVIFERYQAGGSYTIEAEGVKKEHGYATSEWLSDIEMLPSKIKKMFFGKLCDTLSKFHEVADYCEHPTSMKA